MTHHTPDSSNTVLVVEDDKGLGRLIKKNLERAGFHTILATKGAEALDILSSEGDILLLLDYKLPDMTGKQVLERLNEAQCLTPFIVMTGHGDERIAVDMMKFGARDYLVKDSNFLNVLPQVVDRVAKQLTTERRLSETEAKLRESQRSLFTLMSNLPGMAYRCQDDSFRTMTFVSQGCAELTGYEPSSITDNSEVSYIQLIHQDDRNAVLDGIREALKQKQPFQLIYRIRSFDNEERWVWEKGSGVPSAEGQPQALEGFISDITDRKRAEDELQATTQQLAKANRSRTELFNALSHDLRTPINAVLGYASLMRRERLGSITKDQADMLDRIDENAKNLLNMINSILDLAKAEAGQMQVRYESVDIKELITECFSTIEPMARERNISLQMAVSDDVPVLWTDRSKLQRILLNFLSNAAKFTENGHIQVTAGNVSTNGHVQIAVKDTGIGIKEEDLESIFSAFTQVESSYTRIGHGTGLGLSITKTFAALLGGTVGVESTFGEGSTFTVTIPPTASMSTSPTPVNSAHNT